MKILLGKSLSIIIDDEYFEVEIIDEKLDKYEKGKAYLIGRSEYVLPYMGKKDKMIKPGIYKTGKKEFLYNETTNDEYHRDNINSYDVNSIFRELSSNKENFIDVKDVEIINNNSDIYTPNIEDDDDFLKIAIKKAIIEKKINLNNYQEKFGNGYALTNMKSGLRKPTKMTVLNFQRWCEVLGLDWKVVLSDSGEDRISPLKEDIIISSADVNIPTEE